MKDLPAAQLAGMCHVRGLHGQQLTDCQGSHVLIALRLLAAEMQDPSRKLNLEQGVSGSGCFFVHLLSVVSVAVNRGSSGKSASKIRAWSHIELVVSSKQHTPCQSLCSCSSIA